MAKLTEQAERLLDTATDRAAEDETAGDLGIVIVAVGEAVCHELAALRELLRPDPRDS